MNATPPPDHPLWRPELDALLARHNRMEGRYPFETFPYDLAGVIADWLRDNGCDDVADGVTEANPMFLSCYLAGVRAGFLRDRAEMDVLMNALFGTKTGAPQ